LAGALGYLVWRRRKLPYLVESFEPHAAYMRDSNTWKFYDPRFLIQLFFEKQQKKSARYLLPVSINYSNQLKIEGISEERIITMPCCIPIENYAFNNDEREAYRSKLKIKSGSIVGIYVGKFGDIYYDDEAFDLYKFAYEFFGDKLFLIIISPNDRDEIIFKLKKRLIPENNFFVAGVPHNEVRNYLCAADFAFSTIKPSPNRKFCSPIKNAEYWANGLPIITEPNIGDDSDIIANEGGGVILDPKNLTNSFIQLSILLQQDREKSNGFAKGIAMKYRSIEIVKESYVSMLTFLNDN
jgi:hypothetical protein